MTLKSATVGAEEMLISNTADCSSAEGFRPFSVKTAWVLPAANTIVSVYAKFRKTGGPSTDCVKASIVHDNVGPVVSFDQPAPPYTALAAVQIKFSSADVNGSGVAKVLCKPSNGQEVDCINAVTFNAPLAETNYAVTIRAIDKAGNISVPVTNSFIVDRTAPIITINGPAGVVAQADPKYRLTVVDDNGLKDVSCRLAGFETNFKDCKSMAIDYMGLPSGSYQMEVKARDFAGNETTSSKSFENDLSVPSVMFTKTPIAVGNVNDVAFEFTGKSGVKAITNFVCTLDAGAEGSCSSPQVLNGLADKEYVFSVVGINAVNARSAAQSYRFIVDKTPPDIAVKTSSFAASGKEGSGTITLDAYDLNGLKNIVCYLNGSTSDCSNKTVSYTGLGVSGLLVKYTFYAVATDLAGNSKTSQPMTFIIDDTSDSKILANMEVNPISLDEEGKLNATFTSITEPAYSCVKISNGALVTSGKYTAPSEAKNFTASIRFVVSEDIRCDVTALDKYSKPMKVSVIAEVKCGNKFKKNGQCVDFKCTEVRELTYTKTLQIPKRATGDSGICYAMKIFNPIANGPSDLTKVFDRDVISLNHDAKPGVRNPNVLGTDVLNFNLGGPRVVRLSGGLDATTPILVDNYVMIGLYPKGFTPTPAHYAAHGTSDAEIAPGQKQILYKNTPVPLKRFADAGTAAIPTLDIVREADQLQDYTLDIRALDCGGSRELSKIYILFQ